MRNTIKGLMAAGALAVLSAAPAAHALTVGLTDGGGWSSFDFVLGSDPSFQDNSGVDYTYDFTVLTSTWLRVTDGYNDGDQFTLTINNLTDSTSSTQTTSTPTFTGQNIFNCWSCVFMTPSLGATYSHGEYLLSAGHYNVTGDVIQAPFGVGAGAIELGALPGTPEPSTWVMMMVGFGGLGAVLRRRKVAFAAA